jgi:hypothetical protein
MTTKDDLVRLCEQRDAAKRRLDSVGMTNVANRSTAERVEIDLVYEFSMTAYLDADRAYKAALAKYVDPGLSS